MDIQDTTRAKIRPTSTDTHRLMPGILKVIRRNGQITPYNDDKIRAALLNAFKAVNGDAAEQDKETTIALNNLTDQISQRFLSKLTHQPTIHIEDIQDQVELSLMRQGSREVARAYVLYREQRRQLREANQKQSDQPSLHVTLSDGQSIPLDNDFLQKTARKACEGLDHVAVEPIMHDVMRNLFDGIPVGDVSKALIMSSRALIEKEPNYSYVTARLLLNSLRAEALSFLGIADNADYEAMHSLYPSYFKQYLNKGIELGMLNLRLAKEFDLDEIGKAFLADRDRHFSYLSLQTLYDRYFIHSEEVRYELPQAFFMRVAMGLALNEKEKTKRAIEYYTLLSSFDYMSSTPTLFNSGTQRSQLSSCYLSTVPDDLNGIYGAIRDNALLSKFAGGLGNDWTPVRAMGALIKGTNGKSQGVVPFLNVADATAVAVNQGGKRKGAVCAYLETWHLDIEEFLELRKNTGDDRRRTHDMNTANWIPDLFLERVEAQQDWTLFSPNETPDLHELYGQAFKTRYHEYEAMAERGEIKVFKRIKAQDLWRKMLGMLFETGHPWLTFKDPCNLRSPQQHKGVIHSSNLCTEITLNTSNDEIAVCNLGSVNLAAHLKQNGDIDHNKLKQTIRTAIRMLDNVIDINYYAVEQAERSNLKHRPIGLGMMGFQDALYQKNISYASEQAVQFADEITECISYYVIEASCQLAKERGTYESYEGSLWSQGVLPIDSIALLAKNRSQLKQDQSQTLDWDALRQKIKKHGMRNSNTMAIAPTATIANICGVSQSIEPTYQNLYVKSNLSGEFTVINPYLVKTLRKQGLWDELMVNDLKFYDGCLSQIDRIPDNIKHVYITAFELDPLWLVKAASRRQKWIDQAQSLNLYMATPSGKKLDALYREAWHYGLKTTYYLRSLGATKTEKSTLHRGTLNAVQNNSTPKACAIDDPDCEACQ